ncbi:MAG: DUF3592 domain-containing protein [Opitutaceae bacterium]
MTTQAGFIEGRGFALLIALGGVAFGALFIAVGWYLWREGRELRRTGVTANATVQKKFRQAEGATWGGLEDYHVRCTFSDSSTGKVHERDLKVQSKLWRQLRDGGSLLLTFLPGQPETARPGPKLGWKIRGFVGLAMLVVGAAAILIFPFAALRDSTSNRNVPVTNGSP